MDVVSCLCKKALEEAFSTLSKEAEKTRCNNHFREAYDSSLIIYANKFGKDDFYNLFYHNSESVSADFHAFFNRNVYTTDTFNDIWSFIKRKTEDVPDGNIEQFLEIFFAELMDIPEYLNKINLFYNRREHLILSENINEIKVFCNSSPNQGIWLKAALMKALIETTVNFLLTCGIYHFFYTVDLEISQFV